MFCNLVIYWLIIGVLVVQVQCLFFVVVGKVGQLWGEGCLNLCVYIFYFFVIFDFFGQLDCVVYFILGVFVLKYWLFQEIVQLDFEFFRDFVLG